MSLIQFDMDWKVRYQQRGGHIHCDIFSRKRGQATFAKNGTLVIGENDWSSFQQLMRGAEFMVQNDG